MDRITNDFDGSILPYRPKPSFKLEIDELDKRGLLSWRQENEYRVADICYDGQVVGEASYLEDQRDILIKKIFE